MLGAARKPGTEAGLRPGLSKPGKIKWIVIEIGRHPAIYRARVQYSDVSTPNHWRGGNHEKENLEKRTVRYGWDRVNAAIPIMSPSEPS